MKDAYPQEGKSLQDMEADKEYPQFCHVQVGLEYRIKFNVWKVQRHRFFNNKGQTDYPNIERLSIKDNKFPVLMDIFKRILDISSVAQSCLTICNPMDCCTPGLPVHHKLPEFTHVHRVSDAIQPFHPLSSPSPSIFNLTQHQGLFK